jgi:hypothetical protein
MSNQHLSNRYEELLDELQLQSWQLELLISGFAIFGLFQAIDPLEKELMMAIGNNEDFYKFFIAAIYPALTILLIVLLVHVILRGLWIGALGLRYVSGEINYDELNYSKKFTAHLNKKVGSFDKYISKLENICSTLFAIAFLMAFYFLAYMLVIGFFTLVVNLIEVTGILNKDQQVQFNVASALIYFSLAFFVFIDFLGMGILKKGKLRPKIYFPIYRFFSIITLSFLYRPLVYNFLDQRKTRWVATFILPVYVLGTLLVSAFTKQHSNYISKNSSSSEVYANTNNYEDVINENEELVDFATIPSKVITTPYLHLKIPFTPFKENAIFNRDSSLTPKKDTRGYGFNSKNLNFPGISISLNDDNDLNQQKKYMSVVDQMYEIYIDTLVYDEEFIYTTNKNNRLQFETFLDITELEKGKHVLKIIGPVGNSTLFKEGFKNDTVATIPFWHFKNQ